MSFLLETNNKIVINTDIDGILSGLFLVNYLDYEVVGFSNSDNTVWIDEAKINSIYDAVYIDMFVPNDNVKCIDQHITSVNESHHRKLVRNINKINPNLENPRYFLPSASYYEKYPFGTIHFILSLLESHNIRINLDFHKSIENVKFIDLLLRADDAMQTTINSNYIQNAKKWWMWLLEKSQQASSIETIINYLYDLNPNNVAQIKLKTTNLLMHRFKCVSPDGGYKSIMDNIGNLQSDFINYVNAVANISNLECFNTNLKLKAHIGIAKRITLNRSLMNELIDSNKIDGNEIFSYAFVRSAARSQHFSYTIM